MLGKSNNASVRPTALGAMMQSAQYGNTIPYIYGRTRAPLNVIWANNLRKGDSGKKKTRKKTGGASTYTAAVDFLLGANPIIAPLQFWANQNDSYPLTFTSHAFNVASGSSGVLSWNDSKFYCLIAVTIATSYAVTFNDYGSVAPTELSGTMNTPLWNMATAGPNPTRPHSLRYWPFCFYWLPGAGPSFKIPSIATGELNALVADSSHIIVTAYYAQIVNSFRGSPAAQLKLAFEPQLGDGDEYAGYESQQILYPSFAGLGSSELDMGYGAMPNIRTEVLGSYPIYATGDCDFADIIEDLFSGARAQAGYGLAPARSPLQRGVDCYTYPGATQAKAMHSEDASVLNQVIFELGY